MTFATRPVSTILRSPRRACGGSVFTARLAATLFLGPLLLSPVAQGQAQSPSSPRTLGGPVVDGSVVLVDGCGEKFFIAYKGTYAMAQRFGGEMVKRDDVLQASATQQGSFDREGRMEVTNLTTGTPLHINIENAMLSQDAFRHLAQANCR